MAKVFVTSDSHFGHRNIIKYCNRPFNSVEEMDYALESIWNSLVGPEDIVFHLGDVTLAGPDRYGDLLNRLNGKKILIAGNHDRDTIRNFGCWKKVCDSFNFNYKGIDVHMQHLPWVKMNPRHLYLHGHCHGTMGTWNKGQIDVGVDCWDYAPVELEELIEFWRMMNGND